ncbi:hypothetical protein QBZ16_000256 [Prototheca wickerhamii]|uniref:phosphoribosylamine--glycine ligase n=1 Tax=Prototheca wickerhamii TaxID=3111 RepID=A0AAD9MMY3_PROWI|nr:hypothetical protein QBZ16_000256 [Prototheca wickerhamii]
MTSIPSLNPSNHWQLLEFCRQESIDFVVVGPEQYLVEGVVDALTAAGVPAFGPTAAAAELEGSKAFMKAMCERQGIPSAAFASFTDPARARDFVRAHGAPIVVKTSGLAAGKGVTIAQTIEEADAAIDSMLVEGAFGGAGAEIDHKAAYDGDRGPNTGGMGSYSPAPVLTPELQDLAVRTIIHPTARGMCAEGRPFRGVLFAGLMIEGGGVKLLEHNVRFGDPECQSLMVRLRSDLLHTLQGVMRGEAPPLDWDPRPSLTVVMAAKGYPGKYEKDCVIQGLEDVRGAKVFHAGTKLTTSGQVVSAGGRVLGVTALGDTVAEAQKAAYAAVDSIRFPDGFCRRDIGWRAVAREQQAAQRS